jgi:hypothetical protein
LNQKKDIFWVQEKWKKKQKTKCRKCTQDDLYGVYMSQIICYTQDCILPADYTILDISQFTTSIDWPCHCTVHVCDVIHVCDSMWSFWEETNLYRVVSFHFIICIDIGDRVACYWQTMYSIHLGTSGIHNAGGETLIT